MSLQQTPGTIKGDHVLITGPIRGTVVKEDGTVVDVTAPAIAVADQDEADELSFLIGEKYRIEGHPDDREWDEDEGEVVQRPFEHVHDKKFDKRRDKRKTAGKARRESGTTTSRKKG